LKQEKVLSGAFEVKASDQYPHGYISGYASTWSIDLTGDRIAKGAYTKTLQERVATKRVRLVNNHQTYGALHQSVLGMVEMGHEDNHGLHITAAFAPTEAAQEIRKLCQADMLKDFSVGIWLVKHQYNADADCRDITECGLKEISVVMDPANMECRMDAVKSLNNHTSYFPVAPGDTPWDAVAATARYQKWVQNKHDSMRGFGSLVFDDTDGPAYQFVDIVDDRPVVVPAALKAIHSALITDASTPVAKSTLVDLLAAHAKGIGLTLENPATGLDADAQMRDKLSAIKANLVMAHIAVL
jgi:HK97 family phage prohead protease